jgi:hypothetical protein
MCGSGRVLARQSKANQHTKTTQSASQRAPSEIVLRKEGQQRVVAVLWKIEQGKSQ